VLPPGEQNESTLQLCIVHTEPGFHQNLSGWSLSHAATFFWSTVLVIPAEKNQPLCNQTIANILKKIATIELNLTSLNTKNGDRILLQNTNNAKNTSHNHLYHKSTSMSSS